MQGFDFQKIRTLLVGPDDDTDRPQFVAPVADDDPGGDDALILAELAHTLSKPQAPTDPGPDRSHIAKIHRALAESIERQQYAPPGTAQDQPPGSDDDKPYLFGLALSGGGVRSAVFSLGVMQRLARDGVLRHVDYLSTVSGGGYIGSAVSWWLSRECKGPGTFGLDRDSFPYGTGSPADPSQTTDVLTYLRQNGNYLVPGAGITLFSGLAIVLRAILLNLLVWIPILAFAFATIHYFDALLDRVYDGEYLNLLMAQVVNALLGEGVVDTRHIPGIYAVTFVIAAIGLALFFISSVTFSLLSWMAFDPSTSERHRQRAHEPTDQSADMPALVREARFLAVAAILTVMFSVVVLGYGFLDAVASRPQAAIAGGIQHYWVAFVLFLLGNLVVLFLLSSRKKVSPVSRLRYSTVLFGFLALWLGNWGFARAALDPDRSTAMAEILSRVSLGFEIIALIGGVAMVVYWLALAIEYTWRDSSISLRYSGRRRFERVYGLWFPIIIALLIVASIPVSVAWMGDALGGGEGALSVVAGAGTALWGHFKARSKTAPGQSTTLILVIGSILLLYGVLLLSYRLAMQSAGSQYDMVMLAGLAAFSAIIGWFVNINYISIHRYYRDRLMEAFLPDYVTARYNTRKPAGLADEFHLKDVGRGSCAGPYHLINTNVVLVNSRNRKFALRGGDNFILSPLYCGSAATGWQPTRDFIQGGMTLATAMAISGAAANPRAGVGGQGITRNQFVSLAMTFLNLRLGYYVRAPGRTRPERVRPNHFVPGGSYVLPGLGYTEHSSFQELSDGGHFENLALYELVRRRCGLIIICDGGQDTKASYSDFVTALQRIGQDFGTTVSFDVTVRGVQSDPKNLIPRARTDRYPKDAEYSDHGYFVATVDYGPQRGRGPWPRKGVVIYMKTAMIDALDMQAKGYKGAHPDFPDETTADQFFSEPQFEAYRSVGYAIAEQMVDDLDLASTFANGIRPSLGKLRAFPRDPRPGAADVTGASAPGAARPDAGSAARPKKSKGRRQEQ